MKKIVLIGLVILELTACTPVGMAVKGTTAVVKGAAATVDTAAGVVF